MNLHQISIESFRNAMAQIATAVHVITTDGPGGRTGFTASSVCSVTDTPPSVLVCINRASSSYERIKTNRRICINTLGANQHDISVNFSKKIGTAERFETGEWISQLGQPARLIGACLSIDCTVTDTVQVGTHDIFLCRVNEIINNAQNGMLFYHDRKYYAVKSGEATSPAITRTYR